MSDPGSATVWSSIALALGLLVAVSQVFWWRRVQRIKRDLSQQRQDRAELEQQCHERLLSEQVRQEALIDSMIEGVLVLDRTGKVLASNRSLAHSFGLASDIRGRTVMEAFRLHELQELVVRTIASGQVLGLEIHLSGKPPRLLQVNATALKGPSETPQGVVMVFHDITRLKQLENTRQEFVANVSHELRTPLSIIKGYVETLLGGAKDDPEIASRFLETIKRHSDRLTFLIEDLLTISRLESGQVVIDQKQVSLSEVISESLADLETRARERKVTIKSQVDDTVIVWADRDRLEQVLFNLLDNAIKYGRPGGEVFIGASPGEPHVKIWVHDNGPGIPQEAKERVFERFYRVDKARSREQGGTGLGLAIVKHLVQSHGGKVWVESEPGQGATFYFTMPAKAPNSSVPS